IGLALRRRAKKADGTAAQSLHRKGEVGETGLIAEMLPQQAPSAHIQFLLLACNGMAEPPGAAQQLYETAAGAIDVAFVADERSPLFRYPCADVGGKRAVMLGEERPRQEGGVGHQLPWNTGLPLAANASYARVKSAVCMQ